MVTDEMIDQASRYAVYLERLKSREVTNFNRVWINIEKKLKELMLDLDATEMQDVRRSEIESVIRDFQIASAEYGTAAIAQHVLRMEGIAGISMDFNAGLVRNAVRTTVKLKTKAAKETLKAVLKEPMKVNGELMEPWLKQMTDRETQRLSAAIRKSWSDGDTVQKTVQKLVGTKKNQFKDGVTALSRRDAAAAVRTTMSHVSGATQHVFMAENSDLVVGYKWVATLDNRTTSICRSLDGQVFALDDKSAPRLPMHIGERSTTVPDLDDGLDFLDKGKMRSSLNGPIPAETVYYEWLKTQPPAFQADAIGATRAKLLRDGGLSAKEFASLNLGRNFEELSLDEMRKKMPIIFERAGVK